MKFMGMDVIVDPSLPPNVIELRTPQQTVRQVVIPEDSQGHKWIDFRGIIACERCGVGWRRDGKNKQCKGKTPKVVLR